MLLARPPLSQWGANLQPRNGAERAGAAGLGSGGGEGDGPWGRSRSQSCTLTATPYRHAGHSGGSSPAENKAAFFLVHFSLKDKSLEVMRVKLRFSASCANRGTWLVLPSPLLQHKQPRPHCVQTIRGSRDQLVS